MLENTTVPINFGQGVDTKTDPKAVVAGKFLRLENAVFTAPKRATKRNGYAALPTAILGGGNISAPKMVKSFGSELVCASDGKLYSYSPTQQCWVPKGNYNPVKVTKGAVSRSRSNNQEGATCAVLGDIALFAWFEPNLIKATVIDLKTGAEILADVTLASSGLTLSNNQVQCSTLAGGSKLAVFYIRNSLLYYRGLTIGAASASFDSEYSMGVANTAGQMDVCETPTGAAVSFYSSTSNFRIKTYTLANPSSSTITDIAVTINNGNLFSSINYESATGNIWVYWGDGDATNNYIKYAVYDSLWNVVVSSTTVATLLKATYANFSNLTAAQISTGSQRVIYQYSQFVYRADVDSSGVVGSASLLAANLNMYTQCLTIAGTKYIGCNSLSGVGQIQTPTLFFINVTDGTVVAKALSNVASEDRTGGAVLYRSLSRPSVYGSKIIAASGETVLFNGTQALRGASYVMLDPTDADLFNGVSANDTLVLNGGVISAYDGNAIAELGFHYPPEISSITSSTSGSPNMVAGTYSYYAVYRWVDAQGNIHDSVPSKAASITLAATSKTTLTIKTLGITSKGGDVEIRVYRTAHNGASGTATEVFDSSLTFFPIANNKSVLSVTFADNSTDSAISGNAPLYTNGGILENDAPPASASFIVHKNRIWMIPSETPFDIWYSKSFLTGSGVSFNADLSARADAIGGNPIALASLDDKLVVLEERLPLIIGGDGAGDTGEYSTLTGFQPVPSDVGAIQAKGVITTPIGVMFKSPKGIYLLDRSLSVRYWGAEVEAYNSQLITDATLLQDKAQIRFLTSSGLTLVYDYISNQWSTFTNHAGYSGAVFQGVYTYAKTDGKVYQETPGQFLDGSTAYAMLAQTAWLSLGGIQGFQRVKRFAMLGDYTNGSAATHKVRVSAAYDFDPTFSTPVPYSFGSASTSGAFQYRERLPKQKCDSISLLIEEVTTGDSAEYIDLTDMSFEVGVKRGLSKLSQGKTAV